MGNKQIIMGLDASSSTIGLSIIEEDDGKLTFKHVEHFKPMKKDKGNIFERLTHIKEYIISKLEEYQPDVVAIEEFTQFMKNKSQASTIIILGVVNRLIGLTVYEFTGKAPIMLNVNSIRSIIKPKNYIGRISKENVPEVVENILNIKLEKLYNKKGKEIDENLDRADAIAVALSYCLNLIKMKK